MKVRMTGYSPTGAIARLEAFLAGVILTVSTAYAATICPMYWTQLQLEADLQNRLAITAAIDQWYQAKGAWLKKDTADISADPSFLPTGRITNPLSGQTYRLDPVTHRVK